MVCEDAVGGSDSSKLQIKQYMFKQNVISAHVSHVLILHNSGKLKVPFLYCSICIV